MIKFITDANGESELSIEGDTGTCYQESCVALLKICEALSETIGYPFGDVFEAVVANTRLLAFYKGKEREQHEDRA